MAKYRKKPIVIEAVQWIGENWPDLDAFTGGCATSVDYSHHSLSIFTLESYMRRYMRAELDDWIIKNSGGRLSICKPDIFKATYEPVEDL